MIKKIHLPCTPSPRPPRLPHFLKHKMITPDTNILTIIVCMAIILIVLLFVIFIVKILKKGKENRKIYA